jgi:glycosyltransferase involved in cell wall biosynthesis
MKILVLTGGFFPDHTGGISKSLLPEVEGLIGLGHEVTVVTRRLLRGKPEFELREGYELYRYFSPHKKSVFYRLFPFFTMIQLPKLISSLHRQHSFDIAYVHCPFQADALNKSLPNLHWVYVYHASAYSEIKIDADRGKYGKFKFISEMVNNWVKSLEERILTNADKIVVRSQFMKNDINNLYKSIDTDKIVSIPLCVDTERFNFAKDNISARKILNLPEDRPILLTVRRLVARMGIENLITAMHTVVQKFPNVLLLIGGTGYLQEDLQNMISQYNLRENVIILGFISEENLPNYYQAANFFVLPTLTYEGFGLVTIESLACGTPVIATPVGASPELLKPLGEKYLFKSSDTSAISQGILYWLEQEDIDRSSFSNYCVNNFGENRIVNELECVFASIQK